MKKTIALMLVLILILSGCGSDTPLLDTANFSFPMPEGYSLTDTDGLGCHIRRSSDSMTVGGMEVVPLTRKDLTRKSNEKILEYLQSSFHQTNNVEFIAFRYNDQNFPVVAIDMRVHREDCTANLYTHYFFETDGLVYHLWLDTDILGDGDPGDFLSCVTPK